MNSKKCKPKQSVNEEKITLLANRAKSLYNCLSVEEEKRKHCNSFWWLVKSKWLCRYILGGAFGISIPNTETTMVQEPNSNGKSTETIFHEHFYIVSLQLVRRALKLTTKPQWFGQ